ncbi:MAG: permease-like cell division protein FtsX [Actinomycetota bacterium]
MRGVEFYFRETAAAMRRNGTVAFGAVSTAFIALFLFGLALLIRREISLIVEGITGNVQVAVYLTDTAHPDSIDHMKQTLEALPAVARVDFENQAAACAHAQELFANQPTILENVQCSVFPTSLRVTLQETSQYSQITAALGCAPDDTGGLVCAEPGVLKIIDFRDVLDRLSAITNVITVGLFLLAMIMLGSAVVLVSNTLRMGMFARRKEIGIMRLVGATNWRIRLPFLIEGGAESLVGAALAIVTLFLGKVFLVDQMAGKVAWLPLVRNGDVLAILPWIVAAAIGIAAIAGTLGMRRFLDV